MGSLSDASQKAMNAIKRQQDTSDDLSTKGHDLLNQARQLTDPVAAASKGKEGAKLVEESAKLLKRIVGKTAASAAIAGATSFAAAIAAIDKVIGETLKDAKDHSDKAVALLDEYKKSHDQEKLDQANDELERYLSTMEDEEGGEKEIRQIVEDESK